ncbi:TetR/AcrR family transcriptional regulator [Microbulbifer sp. YPW16]|uniref:TetR/AcrR family transcriptional regulator n=1 Tax=unclassified Microbulbifer TaxID=2619833 RepID=UPI001E3CC24C|nr:TetR/AcrR family transcriptional regulator [Microbulbifer sp. YPW16]UHQ55452.1 TetR/AcrR family transcriptional regulator [Microbulbifer sp. YPW16]
MRIADMSASGTDSSRARGGWKKLPEQERRRAILAAARECFNSRGFGSTSVQDIASAAGLTKGGIYFHFESKQAIRTALLEEFTAPERFALEEAAVLALPPRERLLEQLRRLQAGLSAASAGSIVTLAESVTRDHCGGEQVREFFNAAVGALRRTLASGVESGAFRLQLDTLVAAKLSLAAVDGLALHREFDAAGIRTCRGTDSQLALLVDGFMD